MWKDWLAFSKAERNGILILLVFVCFFALFPYFYQAFSFKSNPLANKAVYNQIDSFLLSLSVREKPIATPFSFIDEETSPSFNMEPFIFDPNTVTSAELVHLGFSRRQAAVIENFRIKGGVFRCSQDFAKMYVVDSSMYTKLKPYISINPKFAQTPVNSLNAEGLIVSDVKPLLINLNSADSLELIKLKGIGRGYARRIVAYRQLLGGFIDIGQLTEIYGFNADLLESIRPNIWVDTLSVAKINVNLVNYYDLRKHPYINDYQARAIIYYRETKGNINYLSEILDNKLLDSKTYHKVKGYLTPN
jgi:competence ComEA-like helix-hairpin-helix protein